MQLVDARDARAALPAAYTEPLALEEGLTREAS